MKVLKKYSLLSFAIFISFNVFASWEKDSINDAIVKSLNDDWLVYSKKYEAYVPYSTTLDEETTFINQQIDLKKYKNYNLNFSAAPQLTLFINKKLIYKNTSNNVKNVQIKIDEIIDDNNSSRDILTLYNPSHPLPSNVFIGYQKKDLRVHATDNIVVFKREIKKTDIYILCYLIILTLLAILKTRYPRRFSEFFSFNYMLPNNASDDLVIKSFSAPGIIFILINSFAIALIYLLTNHFLTNNVFEVGNLSFAYFFRISAIVIIIFLVKFAFMKLIGWIYDIEEIVKVQFFELVKVFLNFNILIVSLLIISLSFPYFSHRFSTSIFIYFLVIVFLIVILRNSLLIFKLSGFRNLYLFSYLCTTEILPFVIMIKIFTN